MPAPGLDSTSWQNRLPGHPGGPVSPSWQSPEGLYQYIMGQVPGISPAAAAWMHGRILGGQNFLASQPGVPVQGAVSMATPYGQTPVQPPADGLPYLTASQLAAINQLTPFAQAATNVQPRYPGDPVPVAPTTTTTPPPYVNPILPPDPGRNGYPNPPTYGEIGLPQPPAVPMPGYNTPDPTGGRDPYNDPDWHLDPATAGVGATPGAGGYVTNPVTPPAGGIDYGGYYGPGAAIAEGALGNPAAGVNYAAGHPAASPVNYLRRARSRFVY